MANTEQIEYLVELVSQVPSLRVITARGDSLLTPREEQVVALVAEGLSNREVAQELQISEPTIKKYLFRIFDKLGISTRVELVLYAVSHGAHRPRRVAARGIRTVKLVSQIGSGKGTPSSVPLRAWKSAGIPQTLAAKATRKSLPVCLQ